MPKITVNTLIRGEIPGVVLKINGEQVPSCTLLQLTRERVVEVFYKDTPVFLVPGGLQCSQEVKTWLATCHHSGTGTALADYLDYIVNQDVEHSLFNQDGSVRIRWFGNLLTRIEEGLYHTEVSKRMEIVCQNVEKIRNSKGAANGHVQLVLARIVGDYSGKWVYPNSAFVRYDKTSCKMLNGSVLNGYFPLSGIKVWGGTRYFVPSNMTSEETIEVSGEQVPAPFVTQMLRSGVVFICPECRKHKWNTEKLLDSCISCCGFTREQLELQSYSTRAENIFDFKVHVSNPKPSSQVKFMGVELEYECDGEIIKGSYFALKNLKNHVIVKRDGSLRNGIEIVTAPADIYCHKEEFQKFFSSFGKSNLSPRENTGMHVHVDKGAPILDDEGKVSSYTKMNYLTLGKLSKFLQDSGNSEFITKIAGRSSPQYAKLGTNDRVSSPFLNHGSDRYKGLNLTNSKTIEFRIFATPKDYDTFCKNIEFCDAVTDFCAPGNSSIKDLTEGAFREFVKSHAKAYPYLNKFLHPSKKPATV